MIAATDPQEYIPGGRQQALRHPGPPETFRNVPVCIEDDLLRDRLEKVSLTEADKNAEWWTVRKMPNFFGKADSKGGDGNSGLDERTSNRSYTTLETKSQSDLLFDDSWSCRSVDVNVTGKQGSKRLSDVNASKFLQNKRFSLEVDMYRSESKTSSNKSQVGTSNDPKSENIKFKTELGYMEEELYVRGNVVVWSKGLSYNSGDNARTTICCYSSPFPIKCAIWCTFFLERPEYASKMNPEPLVNDKSSGEPLPCVCVVDTKNVRVYTGDSEDFINTMPFQIRKVWSTKFGIFIEKEVNDLNKNIPAMIFSLSHPLDEITPVCIYRHGCMHTVEESNLQIVFTSVDPSICMVYDTQNGQHSVYKIRRISADEPYDTHKSNMTTPSGFTVSKFKTHLSAVDEKNSMQRVRSPFGSKTTSMTSVTSQNPSRVHTPLGGLSRCHTPAISPMLTGSPWLMRLSRLHSSINNMDSMYSATDRLQTELSNQTYRTMEPMVCIEHVWTESSSQEGSILGAATNVFLSDDMTGQWYLCYFVPSRAQLSIVKIDFSNPSCHVFGMMTSIGARDAVGIPHLHMLAVLDHTGNITLYSGLSILGKLHIGGVLAQHVPSPYAVRKSLSFSPFPRRSSLLPTSGTQGADPRFDEHLLSPVLPSNVTRNLPLHVDPFRLAGETSKVYLNGLRDAVQDRITLQYSDGSYYRITLPNIVSTSLVESCLNVLRQTLQRDVTITLLARWYSTRNSPGSGEVTVESEWNLFGGLLLELMGYDNDQTSDLQPDVSATPTCAPKRQKQHLDGSDADWTFLLATEQHKTLSSTFARTMQFRKQPALPEVTSTPPSCPDCNSVLFPYMKVILYSLHLLYEDLKLNVLRRNELPLLAKFLSRVSSELGLQYYVMHYWRDFPVDCPQYSGKEQGVVVDEFKNFVQWNSFTEKPCSILEYLYDLFRGEEVEAFPVINNINNRARDIVQLCATYIRGSLDSNQNFNYNTFIRMVMPLGKKAKSKPTPKSKSLSNVTNDSPARKVVVMMTEMKINSRDLESYPMGVNFLLHEALWSCRENPPTDWSADAYHLLQRPDLASQAQIIDTKKQSTPVKNKYAMFSQINEVLPIINQVVEGEQEDGMEDVDGSLLKLRFSEDLRVAEARRLLQSSKPVPIVLVQRPDVSDHDFIEEQEKHLYAICTRTMALPVGRGMFTLRTATPVATEPLPVPALCLTGKAPPRGTTVELTHIDTPANMNLWPLFHNGVANGLRIDPEARNIDSNWIVFNKPKTTLDTIMEHVGFLVALGLNGHLRNLNILNTYNYLTKFHEMTTLGILLGLSCAFRATNNMQLTKTLSVHVEGLLPPTSMELDVPQNVQVVSLMGVGLVYQGSAHRHMTEILLTEIGRPPGPEMENSVDRESYSLTAGLALGLVMLRQGGRPSGLSDLNVPDTLHYYMVGGNKRNFIGSQKEKYKVPSFQIREGSSVNLDITAPGATLALGLMYLGTGNRAIADWMAPPDTQYLLDFVRPDFLMLRTLSRALILWHSIEAEKEWVEKQVPETIKPYCMVKPSPMLDIDYEAMNQAYCNIIAGACFALGLKFAGSADETAFQTLLEYCHMFTSLTSKSIADLAGKPTIETCLNVVLLSVSMVMAGTGNLEIMRIVRYLRRRVGLASSAIVTYGSHLAIHMALGLLFLGGGRYTLSNSPASVAALICAFYPKFPTHSNDNRYHLQAFRHLYVLAVEPRLVIPKDITMGRMCYANISVIKMDGTTITFRGPGLIPDLNTLYKVSIKDERYWPIVFERERNWDQLLKLLSSCCCIDVKQRAGCLSYSEDKLGLQSEMARTLTQSDIVPWDPPSKTIASFSSDCIVRHFVDHFLFQHEALKGASCVEEEKLKRNLTRATYDCVVKDKLSVLPLFINIIKIVQDLQQLPTNSLELWHLKMIFALLLRNDMKSTLANSECALSFHQQTLMLVDNWEPSLRPLLKSYILGESIDCDRQQNQKLAGYVTFYNIPYNFAFNDEDLMELVCKLNQAQCNSETVDKVLRILSYIR